MTTTIQKISTAALVLTLAATFTTAGFAQDRNNRKGGNRQPNISQKVITPKAVIVPKSLVAPKSDRVVNTGGNSSGGFSPSPRFLPSKSQRGQGDPGVKQFVAPKSPPVAVRETPKSQPVGTGPIAQNNSGGGLTSVQFVPPKSTRDNAPTRAEFVAPKSNRNSAGSVPANIVAPKAPRNDGVILASTGSTAQPLLLAPASSSTETVANQSGPAPVESTTEAQAAPAPAATSVQPATSDDVAIAKTRAAQRYGYYDQSYGQDDYSDDYSDQDYGDAGYGYDDYGDYAYGSSYGEDCQ